MNIPKAIEIITFEDNATLPPRNDDFWNAVRLGKEALKERAEAIKQGLPLWHELLPGED